MKRVEDDNKSHNRTGNELADDLVGTHRGMMPTGTQNESRRTFGYAATTTYHIARPVIAGIAIRVETRGAQA